MSLSRSSSLSRSPSFLVAVALLFGPALQLAAQDEHAGHVMPMDEAPPRTSTESIRIVDDPERQELTVILGPIDLPALSSHNIEQLPVQEGTIPFDMTIHGYRTHVVDMHGEPVPRVVIHHMNLLDPGRRELFLPIMLRVLAASHETPSISFPGWLFGIPMRAGSTFLALTMLHNPTEVTYEGVTVHLTIEYDRRKVLPLYTITPFHLDAMYPEVSGTKAWDLPPGHSTKSWETSPAIPGLIVGLGGHLHAYASRLALEDVTTGEVMYDVRPKLADDGQILDIPILTHRGRGVGTLVVPGHVYRITAEYWNPFDEVIVDGAMGAVAGAFIPMEDWPAANPGNALYAADYDWVIRSQVEHGMSGQVMGGHHQPHHP